MYKYLKLQYNYQLYTKISLCLEITDNWQKVMTCMDSLL